MLVKFDVPKGIRLYTSNAKYAGSYVSLPMWTHFTLAGDCATNPDMVRVSSDCAIVTTVCGKQTMQYSDSVRVTAPYPDTNVFIRDIGALVVYNTVRRCMTYLPISKGGFRPESLDATAKSLMDSSYPKMFYGITDYRSLYHRARASRPSMGVIDLPCGALMYETQCTFFNEIVKTATRPKRPITVSYTNKVRLDSNNSTLLGLSPFSVVNTIHNDLSRRGVMNAAQYNQPPSISVATIILAGLDNQVAINLP